MIYFTLLNNKTETAHIIQMIKEHCGNHARIMDNNVTTHIELGNRYECMIFTNEFNGAILNIYAKAKDDPTHLTIRCVDINSILEMN